VNYHLTPGRVGWVSLLDPADRSGEALERRPGFARCDPELIHHFAHGGELAPKLLHKRAAIGDRE
jgi:hypothetical protein